MPFNLDPEDTRTPPQTEDSAESGWVEHDKGTMQPRSYADLGEQEELDEDDIGDIADEGPGHRG